MIGFVFLAFFLVIIGIYTWAYNLSGGIGIVNRLSTDSNEKMKIISIANVASNVLQTVLAAVAMPMILFFSKSDTANGRGFLWTTVILAALIISRMII